jgi:hypothetical protein
MLGGPALPIGDAGMKYVLFYDFGTDADADAVIGEHMAAHRARWEQCQARGTLLAIGPFTDRAGALSVFTTREAAVEYAEGDPFVLHGAVSSWSVREWHEVLLTVPAAP